MLMVANFGTGMANFIEKVDQLCEYADGFKFWCWYGKYHREDGPAYRTELMVPKFGITMDRKLIANLTKSF
jgi:hypothetical protein